MSFIDRQILMQSKWIIRVSMRKKISQTSTEELIVLNEHNNSNVAVKCYLTGKDCYFCLLSKMCAPTKFTNDTLHCLKRLHFTPDVTLQCSKHLPTVHSTTLRFH
jgi:hypothetical protein